MPALEMALRTFIAESPVHRDLVTTFRGIELAGNWNSAPSKFVTPIARLKRFYKLLFGVCRNGLLPQKMLEDALKNLENYVDDHGARIYHWNYAQVPLDTAASNLGYTMRMGAAKLRVLAADPKSMQISLAQASCETAECIREICDTLQIVPKDTDSAASERGAREQREATLAAKREQREGTLTQDLDTQLDLACNMKIFEMAERGDFSEVSSVRRTSSGGSIATCSTSRNPMDGYPGHPAPPTDHTPAPSDLTPATTPMKPNGTWDDTNLKMVLYTGPGANLAKQLRPIMDGDRTRTPKRPCHGDIAADLPSGEKVLQPGGACTNLCAFNNPGHTVAEAFMQIVGLDVEPKKQATRKAKPKAGASVQRDTRKKTVVPLKLTAQRTKRKKTNGPLKVTVQRTKHKKKDGPLKLTVQRKKHKKTGRSTLPSPDRQVKEPRRCHCCRAYKKALRQAKAEGKPEVVRRLDAQAAYKKAGREFDMMLLRSSGKLS